MNWSKITSQAEKVIHKTGTFILEKSSEIDQLKVEEKSVNSLVSFVDKEAEKQLVKGLGEILPNSGFLTEEDTIQDDIKEFTWIIDPLDGTTNFLYGLPSYCVSVALQYRDELVIGITYELGQKEMFSAYKGGGTFCNGKQVQVSRRKNLEESLLATGFPYYDFSRSDAYFELLKVLIQNSRGIRRIGSAALDMAYVASGRFDAFFEYSLQPWDVAAGAVLIREAGGKVSDFSGKDNYLFGKELLCGSPEIHKDLLLKTKAIFK
ncbi:MAG: inositol monophosphatase family protein [Chitinophagales bacterium]